MNKQIKNMKKMNNDKKQSGIHTAHKLIHQAETNLSHNDILVITSRNGEIKSPRSWVKLNIDLLQKPRSNKVRPENRDYQKYVWRQYIKHASAA